MIIKHKINMDLKWRSGLTSARVMQGDKYSRNLEITLTDDGVAWEIPSDATAIVRFRKADGTGGNYDTLPNGDTACSIDGNVLTVALAPQVCTSPGPVKLVIGLVSGGSEVNTFDVDLEVLRNPGLDVASENYYKVAGSVPDSGWTADTYLGTDENGNIVTKPQTLVVTATLSTVVSDTIKTGTANYNGAEISQYALTGRKIVLVIGYDRYTHLVEQSGGSKAYFERIEVGTNSVKSYFVSIDGLGRCSQTMHEYDPQIAELEDIRNGYDGTAYETAGEAVRAQAEQANSRIDKATAPAIVCEASGEVITVSDASDRLLHGLTIYGKTTQDGTPTPDNPVELVSVGDGGSIKATVAGKSLVKFTEFTGYNGTQFSSNIIDGIDVITIDTDTSDTTVNISNVGTTFTVPDGRYTISAYIYAPADAMARITLFKSKFAPFAFKNMSLSAGWTRLALEDVTLSKDESYIVAVGSQKSNNVDISFNRCAVELGSAATDYEDYKEPQTLSLSTPNGLPGIPVSSGGNYTDENGQQWICDEVDLARGVYVQRTAKAGVDNWGTVRFPSDPKWFDSEISDSYEITATSDGGYEFAEGKVGICNVLTSYGFGAFYDKSIVEGIMNENSYLVVNLDKSRGIDTVDKFKAWCSEVGFEVLKPLATPIETALSAEELAAYDALRSNYPNTTVYNDAGAGMQVKYVADTKTYIDNKFSALSAAIVNNT